ncbi:hypothetical protein ACOMHN_063386 [Nucella lapillus]
MQTNNLYDPAYLLWPYMSAMYPGKAHGELAIHPAFMATQLPAYHNFCRGAPQAAATTAAAAFMGNKVSGNDHHRTPHQPHRRYHPQPRHSTPQSAHTPTRPKKSSFTIDAILHGEEDRVKEELKDQHSPTSQFSSPSPIQHLQQTSPENYLSVRRQQRLIESAAHPYYDGGKSVTPIATATAKSAQKGVSEKKSGSKGKRVRTIFTPEQLERLEAEFERQQYMVGTERYYLAASLSLTEAQVKVWFQNRRIKWRKQTLEQQHARLASLYANNSASDSDDDSSDERDDAPKITPVSALCPPSVVTTTAVVTSSSSGHVGGHCARDVSDGVPCRVKVDVLEAPSTAL